MKISSLDELVGSILYSGRSLSEKNSDELIGRKHLIGPYEQEENQKFFPNITTILTPNKKDHQISYFFLNNSEQKIHGGLRRKGLEEIISNNFPRNYESSYLTRIKKEEYSSRPINPIIYEELTQRISDNSEKKRIFSIKEEISEGLGNFPHLPLEAETPLVEVKSDSKLPPEYRFVAEHLAHAHPGIRFKKVTTLRDLSQHNVDVLAFEYEENGVTKQLQAVAKDADERETAIPEVLGLCRVPTHSIWGSANGRFAMEFVGTSGLRDIVRTASESEMIAECGRAVDAIAVIHVTATQNLRYLREDMGIRLPPRNYAETLRSRFIMPVSGSIISPYEKALMQAYSNFMRVFKPNQFVHGDFHPANCRTDKNTCYVFDWEWAGIGTAFDDLARFVNAVSRDRSVNEQEFAREMLRRYSEKRAMACSPDIFDRALVNDELYKIGEYLLFGEKHPAVAQEKLEKSVKCFERAVMLLDGIASRSIGRNNQAETAVALRTALIDYVASSHVRELREAALGYKAPRIYVPMAA